MGQIANAMILNGTDNAAISNNLVRYILHEPSQGEEGCATNSDTEGDDGDDDDDDDDEDNAKVAK